MLSAMWSFRDEALTLRQGLVSVYQIRSEARERINTVVRFCKGSIPRYTFLWLVQSALRIDGLVAPVFRRSQVLIMHVRARQTVATLEGLSNRESSYAGQVSEEAT